MKPIHVSLPSLIYVPENKQITAKEIEVEVSKSIDKTVENAPIFPSTKWIQKAYYLHKPTHEIYLLAWVNEYWLKLICIDTGRYWGKGIHSTWCNSAGELMLEETFQDYLSSLLGEWGVTHQNEWVQVVIDKVDFTWICLT